MSGVEEPPETRVEASGEPSRPPRHRRGLIKRALRVFGLAGDTAEAALALANAEIDLARAALPGGIGWFCAALVFGVSLAGCGWVGLLYLLYRWTNSLGIALASMAAGSALLFGVSAWFLVRSIHMLSFPESRHRLVAWLHLHRRRKNAKPTATTTG